MVVWPSGITPFHPDEAALDILSQVLTSGRTSRFYRSLVFEKQVASDVGSDNGALGLGGYFEIDVTPRQGHAVAELKPLVDGLIKDIQEKGPTVAEVDRAKRNIIAAALRSVERIGGFGGKADTLNNYEMWRGDPGYLAKDLARYRAVTPEIVKAAAQKYLTSKRLLLDVEPAAHVTAAAP